MNAPVRRIKTKPIYDEAVFCDAVMDAIKDPGGGTLLAISRMGHKCPEDVAMDFVAFMLRSGRWKDYRLDRGCPIQFVVDWLLRFARWKLSNRHEARARKARGFGEDEVVGCTRARRDAIDDADRAAKAIRFARAFCPDDAEIFEVFIRTGSLVAAQAAVDLPRTDVWAALCRVKKKVGPYIPTDQIV